MSILSDAVARAARTVPRGVTAATASLGVACLMLTTACYTYDVKAPSDLMAGQEVEVIVNNVGRVALLSDLGDDVAKFDGKVVTVADTMLSVSVDHVDFLNGSSTGFPGGTVSISRNAITQVSTRQFSRSKTAITAVGIVAAIAAVIGVLHATGFGDSGPGVKDPGNGSQTQ